MISMGDKDNKPEPYSGGLTPLPKGQKNETKKKLREEGGKKLKIEGC